MTILDRDQEGKNIVLSAVENRQSNIYHFLFRTSNVFNKVVAFREIDKNSNDTFHIAAT